MNFPKNFRLIVAVCVLMLPLVLPTVAQVPSATGSISAAAGTVAIGSMQFNAAVAVSVSGTWSGTLVFEGTVDGTTYYAVPAAVQATGIAVTSTTANGQWVVPAGGVSIVRVRMSSYTSGTAVVTLRRAAGGVPIQPAVNSAGPVPLVACDSSATITVSAAATAKLITGVAGKQTYICGFSFSGDTAATVATFQKGTGTTCGTGTAAITGAYKVAANGTLAYGSGVGTILAPVAASTDVCLAATTGAVAGTITYTQF